MHIHVCMWHFIQSAAPSYSLWHQSILGKLILTQYNLIDINSLDRDMHTFC